MKNFLVKYGIMLCKYLLVVFTPIIPTILWLGVFVFIDLFTGIVKAKRKGDVISSKRMSETVTKVMLYASAIVSCYVLDTQIIGNSFLPIPIWRLAAGYIAVVEVQSNLENVSEILNMPLWQFIKDKFYRVQK